MTTAEQPWIAHAASALCAGSRWISGASIALALLAALTGWLNPQDGTPARTALALVAVAGAAQAYLAARIEFDYRIFEALRPGETLEGFDVALGKLGWRGARSAGRPLAARAAGLVRLVRLAGSLLVAQLAVAVAVQWLSR